MSCCYITNNITQCKRSYTFSISINKKSYNYCNQHCNISVKKYILTIQKIWRGFKSRTKIKNLFIILPRELQKIVIYHMSSNLYFKKQYSVICNIIYKKINKFCETVNYDAIIFIKTHDIKVYLSSSQINELSTLLKLIIKYNIILCKKKIKEIIFITNTLHINYILSNVEILETKKDWEPLVEYFNILHKVHFWWNIIKSTK